MAFRNRRSRTRKSNISRKSRRIYRRKYKRVRRGIPRGVSVQANIPRMQKLRYVQDVQLTSTAGAPGFYQFRANSLYDPDYTGTGHQPMRFDQMAAIYADYCVVGSKINVKHVGNGLTNVAQKLVVYLNDTHLTSLLYVNDLIEQGRCKYICTNDNSAKHRDSVSLGFSAKKFFGVTNIKDNILHIGAPVDQNPTDQAIFIIANQPLDGSSTCSIWVTVTIDYLVWFSQPLKQSTS